MEKNQANLKTAFETNYMNALRAIINFDEKLSGARLNKVRDMLKSLTSEQDAPHVQQIKTQLRLGKLESLYGDFKSVAKNPEARSPWIKDIRTLSMLVQHINLLGTYEDKAQCRIFLKRTSEVFRQPVPLAA